MVEEPVKLIPRTGEQIDMQPIMAAMRGEKGPAQQRIAEAGVNLVRTLLAKNTDYGNSAFEAPLLLANLPARDGILARMSDKVKRIIRLRGTGTAEVAESLSDTVLDLGGYCILWVACPEEKTVE